MVFLKLVALLVTLPSEPTLTYRLLPPQTLVDPSIHALVSQSDVSPALLQFGAPEQEKIPGWMVIGGRLAGALAGATAAAITHEFGHALLAWGYGYGFSWPTPGNADPFLPYWELRPANKADKATRRNIAIGGFLISTVTEELLLTLPFFPKSDIFVGGYLFYGVLNAVSYVLADIYLTSRGGNGAGDIRDMARGDVPRPVIYLAILGSSAVTIAQVLENPDYIKISLFSPSTEPR